MLSSYLISFFFFIMLVLVCDETAPLLFSVFFSLT